MKTILLSFLILTSTARAEEKCLKVGQEIEVYGAVDMFHFFHNGNGFHITSPLIRTMNNYCLETESGEKLTLEGGDSSYQIDPDSQEKYSLKDGELVKVVGIVQAPGDTAWYSGHALLEIKTIKKYKNDPAREEFERDLGR